MNWREARMSTIAAQDPVLDWHTTLAAAKIVPLEFRFGPDAGLRAVIDIDGARVRIMLSVSYASLLRVDIDNSYHFDTSLHKYPPAAAVIAHVKECVQAYRQITSTR